MEIFASWFDMSRSPKRHPGAW